MDTYILYYIKGRQIASASTPQQACWTVRKIFEARGNIENVQWEQNAKKSLIRQIYFNLLGDYPRVEWKSLLFNNAVRPNAKFIICLMMHDRVLTDRLSKWGMNVNTQCILCQMQEETRDHLCNVNIQGESGTNCGNG